MIHSTQFHDFMHEHGVENSAISYNMNNINQALSKAIPIINNLVNNRCNN